MTGTITGAMELARKAHAGQMYGDEDYFGHHINNVARKVACLFLDHDAIDTLLIVAYLHDILEDTSVTYDELVLQFGAVVAKEVKTLTRNSGESYNVYIDRLQKSSVAARVKYADSYVNLEKCIGAREFVRAEKYLRNLQRLSQYIEEK